MIEVPVGRNKIEISWNKDSNDEVELARKKFEEYTRQSWFAYVEMPNGSKQIIYDFDPLVEKIILIHAITGG
ncbi:hypothetical protein [[Eubacterium] cellulosolvens]